MCITEETLNHLLPGSIIDSLNKYGDTTLHILLTNRAIVTLHATDDGILEIDILGPDAPHRGDQFAWGE